MRVKLYGISWRLCSVSKHSQKKCKMRSAFLCSLRLYSSISKPPPKHTTTHPKCMLCKQRYLGEATDKVFIKRDNSACFRCRLSMWWRRNESGRGNYIGGGEGGGGGERERKNDLMRWQGCKLEEGEGRNDSKGGREEGTEGKLLISGLLSQREQRLQGQQAASRTFSL